MSDSKSAEVVPVSDYYSNNILDSHTITKGGGWWTALVLIEDPRTKIPLSGRPVRCF